MRKLCSFLLFLYLSQSSAQLSYDKSSYNEFGEAGTTVTPTLKVENTGPNSVEVFVNRINLNLPVNWTQCFCFISCHPPSLDSLRFTLVPGETANIGIGFNSDSVPGIGYMNMCIGIVGGMQQDTFSFSGSTFLPADIDELSLPQSFKVFPNPVTSQIIFSSVSSSPYHLAIVDAIGKLVYQTPLINEKSSTLSLQNYPGGIYFIRASYLNGKVELQKVIKN
jgi:hypothetical protein